MSNTRKFLDGELKYVKGRTSVDGFLETIASELVKTGWVDYKKRGSSTPWAFNEDREIDLKESFRKENVRLFKTVALTETQPSGSSIGKIKVIRGVTTEGYKTLNMTLNGERYNISLEVGNSREEVATKLKDFIRLLDGFEDTNVEEDGITVSIEGSIPVYDLSTNSDLEDSIAGDMVTFTEITEGLETGTIRILSDVMKSGTINLTVNEDEIAMPVSEGQNAQQVARLLRDRVKALGSSFGGTTVVENIITVSGDTPVTNISLDTDDDQVTNIISEVIGGYGEITILSEAREDGDIVVSINGSDRIVGVFKGDTPVSIAQKIQGAVSQIVGFTRTSVADNVVTVSGTTTVATLTTNMDVDKTPIAYTSSTANIALDVGILEIATRPSISQVLTINLNNEQIDIAISGGDSISTIVDRIRGRIANIEGFEATVAQGDRVRIIGNIAVFDLSTSNDQVRDMIYVNSRVTTGGQHMGIIEVLRNIADETTLQITINGDIHVVSISANSSSEDIASAIALVLAEVEGFEDTTSQGSTVTIIGTKSVDRITVSAIEIPEDDFEVHRSIIRGVGGEDSGTRIGDSVLIKTIYQGDEFQRLAFTEEETSKGGMRYAAQLKSRPQGDITVYEDTIMEVKEEVLQQTGEHKHYKIGRSPVSKSQSTHKLTLSRGIDRDTLSEVDPSEYIVDYFNGTVTFKKANDENQIIVADYGLCTGITKEIIPSSKYRIINDKLIDITDTNELADLDVVIKVNYHWELAYPGTLAEITGDVERIILKTKVDSTSLRNKDYTKDYFLELRHSSADKDRYLTGIECRYGTALDGSRTTLDSNTSSVWSRWAWFDREGFVQNGLTIGGWLPVHYRMNFTQEYLNIVVQGSPTVDVAPYNNHLISHMYLGALDSYDNAELEDIEYNFGMTVGGDELYLQGQNYDKWGQRTGTSVTDINMERTGDGTPFQAHYPSFHTSPEFMDKHFIGESEYTGNYHFSEVVVTHPVQRERGKMRGLLVGDRSAIHHHDTLVSNKDIFDDNGILLNDKGGRLNECGGANESLEKKWVMFNINSPYWFTNNSPNVFYGIALRKS